MSHLADERNKVMDDWLTDLKSYQSGAKLPQFKSTISRFVYKLSASKTQQYKLAAKQRFTRTKTLVLKWSAAEQTVANR